MVGVSTEIPTITAYNNEEFLQIRQIIIINSTDVG
jgi:hypothetical protein